MSHWNYRILRHGQGDDVYFAMHEVYYNDDGTVACWSERPVRVLGEDQQGILCTLKWMRRALRKPILAEVEGKLMEARRDGQWVQPVHRREGGRRFRQLCELRSFIDSRRNAAQD